MGAKLSFSDTVVSLTINPMKTTCLKEVTEIDRLFPKQNLLVQRKDTCLLGKRRRLPSRLLVWAQGLMSFVFDLFPIAYRLLEKHSSMCAMLDHQKRWRRDGCTAASLFIGEERRTKNDMGKFKSLNTLGEMDGKRAAFIVHRVQDTFSRTAWHNPLGNSLVWPGGFLCTNSPLVSGVSYLLQCITATAVVPSCLRVLLPSFLVLSMLILWCNSHTDISTSDHFSCIHAILSTIGMHIHTLHPVTIS